MRKIILATAALVGLAGPAFADMTLPAGDYPQVGSPAPLASEARAPAFNATAEPGSTHFFVGRGVHGRTHHYIGE